MSGHGAADDARHLVGVFGRGVSPVPMAQIGFVGDDDAGRGVRRARPARPPAPAPPPRPPSRPPAAAPSFRRHRRWDASPLPAAAFTFALTLLVGLAHQPAPLRMAQDDVARSPPPSASPADTSPVYAPWAASCMFCAPSPNGCPAVARPARASAVKGGHTTTSTASTSATSAADLFAESGRLRGRLVHFPVACNERLAHTFHPSLAGADPSPPESAGGTSRRPDVLGPVLQRGDTGKFLALQELQRRPAAGRHVAHLVGEPVLGHRRGRVAAAYDGDGAAAGHGPGHVLGALGEGRPLEDAHGPVPDDGARPLISRANSRRVFGPMSSPCQSAGISSTSTTLRSASSANLSATTTSTGSSS